jgi:GTP-binding protein Era
MAKAKAKPKEEPRSGRVAIVGRPNVGKSTLLNALLGEPIAITSKHPQTTRDTILGVLTRGAAQFLFVDTPGLHKARTRLGARMNAAAKDAAREADVVLFITSVADPPRPTMSPEDKEILAAIPEGVPVVLVINKVDRVGRKAALLPVLEAYGKERAFAAVVPVSALRGDGTEGILQEVSALLPARAHEFEADAISDKPVRFFVAEFVREQILKKTFNEVPHGVAVVVERFDESGDVPRIELAIHVDRESHKGIIIGARGALLKAIGTEARAKVEQMVGKQVHLQLWVRVTPRWYEDEARLAELGYAKERGGS